MSEKESRKYTRKVFLKQNIEENKIEMVEAQAIMQAITQATSKSARAAVYTISEAVDPVEISAGRNTLGSGPKEARQQLRHSTFNSPAKIIMN